MGFFKSSKTGNLKKGRVAAVAGGTAVGGLALWSLFDPNASEKAGSAAGNVGGTLGNIVGGLGGGLTGGLFESFMSPTVLSACAASSSLICFAVVILMMMR